MYMPFRHVLHIPPRFTRTPRRFLLAGPRGVPYCNCVTLRHQRAFCQFHQGTQDCSLTYCSPAPCPGCLALLVSFFFANCIGYPAPFPFSCTLSPASKISQYSLVPLFYTNNTCATPSLHLLHILAPTLYLPHLLTPSRTLGTFLCSPGTISPLSLHPDLPVPSGEFFSSLLYL